MHLIRHTVFWLFLLAAVLFFSSYLTGYLSRKTADPVHYHQRLQQAILEYDRMLHERLIEISSLADEKGIKTISPIFENSDRDDREIMLFLYRDDSLQAWNSASVPVPLVISDTSLLLPVTFYRNGVYRQEVLKNGSETFLGLYQIRQQYRYQNDFLETKMGRGLPDVSGIEISGERGKYNILSATGGFLFSYSLPRKPETPSRVLTFMALLDLLGLILLLSAGYQLYIKFRKYFSRTSLFLLMFFLDLVILRLILAWLKFPAGLFDSSLFSPAGIAISAWIPSLGDLLLHVLFLLAFCYAFFRWTRNDPGKLKNKAREVIITWILVLFLFITFHGLTWLIQALVLNSGITLNLNDIPAVSWLTAITYAVIGLLLLSFVLVGLKLIRWIEHLSHNPYLIILLILVSAILSAYFIDDDVSDSLIPSVFCLFFMLFALMFMRQKGQSISLSQSGFYILLFALFSTLVMRGSLNKEERERQELLALKVMAERDPLTELMFTDLKEQLLNDSSRIMKFALKETNFNRENLQEYLNENYFFGTWNRYDITATLCNPNELLNIRPLDTLVPCEDYFNSLVGQFGEKTATEDLYFMDYGNGQINYLSMFRFGGGKVTLILELNYRFTPKDLGYPELLVDRRQAFIPDIGNYAYAVYKDGELMRRYGLVAYAYKCSVYPLPEGNSGVFTLDDVRHFYTRFGNTEVLVSRKKESLMSVAAPFSYLSVFYALLSFLFLLLIRFRQIVKLPVQLTFRERFQAVLTGVMIFSFFLIGIGSIVYFYQVNQNKNKENLSEKSHSILIELQHKLADKQVLDPSMHDYLEGLLVKFSNVFFSDINLYNPGGYLLASSRQQIFDEGLISGLLDPVALGHLRDQKKMQYIQEEQIGRYAYLSAYLPLINNDGNVIAYLNLPYFARQDQMRKEVFVFLVAYINVYLILLGMVLFLTLLISRYLTRPLRILQEKIGSFRLGNVNEKIEWKHPDEIGNLITEYNKLVDELTLSAERLAASERESAWREMAMQVAHEIKNPLTPMKLSVQLLRKAWQENDPGYPEKLEKLTCTIIEQIDSLTAIAGEFSDFAKMPQTKNQPILLDEVIRQTLDLYTGLKHIRLEFSKETDIPAWIYADRNQVMRVLNNLINNSLEALTGQPDGHIRILMIPGSAMHEIRIRDNGPGVPAALMTKVFMPNFTTKSGGTGLGLAIVRSILHSMGGTVSLEESSSRGCVFAVRIPAYQEKKNQ